MSADPMRCAVLGQPIAHSLSPVLHRAAYAELGLDWTYDAIEVGSSDLSAFLDGRGPEWRGLSLTMPLKRTVLPLVDSLDEWASLSGVANTVVFEGGRRGFNTDIPGALAAIDLRTPATFSNAVVLGGGATAASVLLALASRGLPLASLRVRSPERADETLEVVARHHRAPSLSVGLLSDSPVDADLLVSTIPAAAQTPELLAAWANVPVVFEVLYDPWPTPLAQSVLDSGRTLVTGLDLLIAQAGLQVTLMTGAAVVPLDAMRAAGERALALR